MLTAYCERGRYGLMLIALEIKRTSLQSVICMMPVSCRPGDPGLDPAIKFPYKLLDGGGDRILGHFSMTGSIGRAVEMRQGSDKLRSDDAVFAGHGPHPRVLAEPMPAPPSYLQ